MIRFCALLLVFAAPSIAAQPPVADIPVVRPGDPAARLQGDGHPIKFDPACREYSVVTLPSNPACAARVAAGETAPSLAVAVQSAALNPPRKADAVAILTKAIAVEDHPAAHYLLGMIYAIGGVTHTDNVLAVDHLTIASDRGNPAAADLLARLVFEGKGTPRDMPRAVRLYRQAAAGGVPSAATSLALLYLQGWLLPRDPVLGGKLIAAAAAAGDPQAKQLAPLAASDGKLHNVRWHNLELIPAEADTAVTTREYGLFDTPVIPPSFGFDGAFQAVYFAPYDDPAILAELDRDAPRLTAPYLYEFARRLSAKDPPRALRVFLLALTRMTYDTTRCADPAALKAVNAWGMLVTTDLRFALTNSTPASQAVAARAALVDEAAMPGDAKPWWVCRSGTGAITTASAHGAPPLALKPMAEWPALRVASRAALEKLAAATAP